MSISMTPNQTLENLYEEAIIQDQPYVLLLIDLLVQEKKVLKMTDHIEALTYYTQEKWRDYVNQHLIEYKKKRGELF
ncbi:hypothetical protein [Niallia taxi]|uniref:Uncharacterized protein n=1 Tax=Niallia taxi TaxID=2499688 RepID=A0A3S2TQX0_9BACI|nr:hypothetical protein [Niallia taxi]RVT56431.1 hypothetical protein EM808_27470 [Niallia taxi]